MKHGVLTSYRAGGIVSETTYKFFIQFCVYAMSYCTFTLVVSAYYVAQLHRLVCDHFTAYLVGGCERISHAISDGQTAIPQRI